MCFFVKDVKYSFDDIFWLVTAMQCNNRCESVGASDDIIN